MKNKKKAIKKYSNLKKSIPALILICYMLFVLFKNAIINFRLTNQGVYTKAVVYDNKRVGGKGKISTMYYFIYKNNKYYGSSLWDNKVVIGDSIIVFFLESDPNTNRSNSLLEIPIKNDLNK